MSQKLLIDGSRESQTQVALLSENGLDDFEFESASKNNLKLIIIHEVHKFMC